MSSNTPETPGGDPFGGFDMNALLQQAQQMQQQVMSAQEELAEARVDGTVADGLVTVTVSGTGRRPGLGEARAAGRRAGRPGWWSGRPG